MQAGRIRQRVTIQQATESQNTFGEVTKVWSNVATVWAAVEPLQGREYLAAKQQQAAEVTTRVVIRHRSGVTPKMRVVWQAHTYEIVSVIADPTHRREMELMCVEAI